MQDFESERSASHHVSSLKVCAAKHDFDQKIHSLFSRLEAPIKLKSGDEFKIHEQKDSGAKIKTQELKLRSERIPWGRNFVEPRLSLQNLLRVERSGERSWGEWWFWISWFTNIVFLEGLKQWLRICLCVPTTLQDSGVWKVLLYGWSAAKWRSASHPLSRGCFLERECSKLSFNVTYWNYKMILKENQQILSSKACFVRSKMWFFEGWVLDFWKYWNFICLLI